MGNLNGLLNGSNGVNNNIQAAIEKLSFVMQNSDNDLMRGILNDLMLAQMGLVNLDKGMVESLAPDNKEYLQTADERIKATVERQNAIMASLAPKAVETENSQAFIQ